MKKLCLLFAFILFLCIFGSAFAESYTFKVAGVTFDNTNGVNRQRHLANFYFSNGGPGKAKGSFLRYQYQGKPAIYVLLEGKIIGNVPAEEVETVLSLLDDIEDTSVYVNFFRDENDKIIYYARVTVTYETVANSLSSSNALSSTSTINTKESVSFLLSNLPWIAILLLLFASPFVIRYCLTNSESKKSQDRNPTASLESIQPVTTDNITQSSSPSHYHKETSTYMKTLPGLWHMFLWYAHILPIIYLTLPLTKTNSNHFLWISVIVVFLSLFSRVILKPFITDCVVLLLYATTIIFQFQRNVFDRLDVAIFISATFYLIFFFKYSLPDMFGNR